MAICFKCDICGGIYEYNFESDTNNSLVFGHRDLSGSFDYYTEDVKDVCPSCQEAIDKLIEDRNPNK